ncbi:hypothetical protein HHL21_13875 [Massilia sp. RP-1-19]|uniref:Lipoprotein n=1 Tax=Massilia polaris TaxID=2728846 RepID=A0A848HLQ1_9BURK|nr:hypothetical protein [Massilia polaris]NML62144.1 hypothetical protein [Massilia polaris]
MAIFKRLVAVLALAALGGCATLSEPDQQVVLVQTIQDNREVAGIGCVLTNDAGRWFVTTPGRVSVRKSAGKLWVDCKRSGAGVGQDVVDSRANAGALMGNVVLTAGLGYLVDKRTGAGFEYPDTLTVLMRRPGGYVEDPVDEVASNALY